MLISSCFDMFIFSCVHVFMCSCLYFLHVFMCSGISVFNFMCSCIHLFMRSCVYVCMCLGCLGFNVFMRSFVFMYFFFYYGNIKIIRWKPEKTKQKTEKIQFFNKSIHFLIHFFQNNSFIVSKIYIQRKRKKLFKCKW